MKMQKVNAPALPLSQLIQSKISQCLTQITSSSAHQPFSLPRPAQGSSGLPLLQLQNQSSRLTRLPNSTQIEQQRSLFPQTQPTQLQSSSLPISISLNAPAQGSLESRAQISFPPSLQPMSLGARVDQSYQQNQLGQGSKVPMPAQTLQSQAPQSLHISSLKLKLPSF